MRMMKVRSGLHQLSKPFATLCFFQICQNGSMKVRRTVIAMLNVDRTIQRISSNEFWAIYPWKYVINDLDALRSFQLSLIAHENSRWSGHWYWLWNGSKHCLTRSLFPTDHRYESFFVHGKCSLSFSPGYDISESQVEKAVETNQHSHVQYRYSRKSIAFWLPKDVSWSYRVIKGKDIPHENASLTLIISGQAAHWLDLPHFYSEVKRTLKTNGVLALFGYAFVRVEGQHSKQLNKIITDVSDRILPSPPLIYALIHSSTNGHLMVMCKWRVKKCTSAVIEINDFIFHCHRLISPGNLLRKPSTITLTETLETKAWPSNANGPWQGCWVIFGHGQALKFFSSNIQTVKFSMYYGRSKLVMIGGNESRWWEHLSFQNLRLPRYHRGHLRTRSFLWYIYFTQSTVWLNDRSSLSDHDGWKQSSAVSVHLPTETTAM